jgi:hypothetical protein
MYNYRLTNNAFQSSEDYKDPRVSPLINTSFEGLPPCLFIVAELDPLRDGNLGMQQLLMIEKCFSTVFQNITKCLKKPVFQQSWYLLKVSFMGFYLEPVR